MHKVFVLVAMVLALAGVSAQAQPSTSDILYGEVFEASITAVFGGVAGGLVSFGGVLILVSVCPYPCSSAESLALAVVTALALPIIAGVAAGAALGVVNAGRRYEIESNPWLALAGAFVGESVALTASFLAIRYKFQLPNITQVATKEVLRKQVPPGSR